jgi:hypothetical protein
MTEPKTLFDLCTCLDYGIEMDVRLANASQADMVGIFVPNTNECHATQKLIQIHMWRFAMFVSLQHFFIIIISSFCHILTHLLNSH